MPIAKNPIISNSSSEKKFIKKDPQNKSFFNLILIIILIILLICFAIYYIKFQKVKNNSLTEKTAQNQEEIIKKEITDLKEKIGKLILLPTNEEPVVATIVDSEKLKTEQPFYKDAQNGDKLLVYQQEKKAIIYSPSKNILVNVGTVFFDDTGEQQITSTPQTPQEQPQVEPAKVQNEILKLEIRNGSNTPGKAQLVADGLDKNMFEVIKVEKASKTNYENNILINIKGKDLSALENLLGVKAVTMPAGEATSEADALIIIGNK